MKISLKTIAYLISAALLTAPAAALAAQGYPQRPVRIVVPVSAGGGVDTLARIVGQYFNAVWGQPFIVDNRPGVGGSLGAEIVSRATPDGYTLMVSSSYVTNAAIRDVRYDPIRDFQPITKLTTNPYIIVVTPSLPVKSVNDLIALAKAKPDSITYASSGTGGVLHLGAELLTALTNTRMTHVPYKGVADGYPAVISGQVNWMLGSPISAQPLMKAGRLKCAPGYARAHVGEARGSDRHRHGWRGQAFAVPTFGVTRSATRALKRVNGELVKSIQELKRG